MTITVLFHSYLRELTGCAATQAELPAGGTVADLLAQMRLRFPKLAGAERSTLTAVGVEYQPGSHPLSEGDEVSLFPPVQGG